VTLTECQRHPEPTGEGSLFGLKFLFIEFVGGVEDDEEYGDRYQVPRFVAQGFVFDEDACFDVENNE